MKKARDPAYLWNDAQALGFRLEHDTADRVYRGGGWHHSPQVACTGKRIRIDSSITFTGCGFRLVADGAD
jgi:hypothetical protein